MTDRKLRYWCASSDFCSFVSDSKRNLFIKIATSTGLPKLIVKVKAEPSKIKPYFVNFRSSIKMSSSTKKLVQISAVLLTLITTPKPLAASSLSFLNNITIAQSVNSNTVYSLPESLPSGTKIRLYGSNSMTVINRSLKQRYEENFPNAQVELAAGSTSEVLEALLKGETEIAAIGRPLTAREKERGLVEVPIERGKIAVIVGPENPFVENLSFDQFAKILRGEITNWSEIGGSQIPIRFIDRPDFSDTREALKSYDVFKTNPFQTGGNATLVSEDDTAAVIKELGKDGISYAIADQVLNEENVRIISMHKTLPDDPRYPYSQPRNYIYNKNAAPPEVLAFMGLVTSPVGKEVVAKVDQEGETDAAISPGVATTTNPDTATETPTDSPEVDSGETDAAISPGVATTTNPDTATETGVNQSSPDPQTEAAADSSEVDSAVPGAVVTVPSPNTSTVNEANSSEVVTSPSPSQSDTALLPNDTNQETETEAFPWWLLLLLGIPLLGALIWGLQRGRGDDSAQTDTEIETFTPVDESKTMGSSTLKAGEETTVTVDGNETISTGGIPIAPIAGGLGVAGLLAAWASRPKNSEISLTAQPNQSGLATWSVPETDKDAAKSLGGQQYQLRVYDVTDIDLDSEPTPSVQQYDLSESTTEKELDSLAAEHDYQTEIGYVTDDGEWLKLARSEKLRISAPEVETTIPVDESESTGVLTPEAVVDTTTPDTDTTTVEENETISTGGIPIAPIAGGLGLAGLLAAWATRSKNSEISLTAQPNQSGLATWSVPEADKDAAKSHGGQQYQLRVYDVTDIDLDSEPTPSVQQYDLSESTTEKELDSLAAEHDYQTEIGYVTDDGEWLKLARSDKLKISAPQTIQTDIETATPVEEHENTEISIPAEASDTDTTTVEENETVSTDGIAAGKIVGAIGVAGLLAAWANRKRELSSKINLTSHHSRSASATWSVPEADKDAAKLYGGQQYQLRVYDVTNIDLESQSAHSTRSYDSEESNQQWQVGNLLDDCEYQAEIGYATDDDQWLLLARSNRVRISEYRVDGHINVAKEPELDKAPVKWVLPPCKITITPENAENMMVAWEVPQTVKNSIKEQGGEQYQLRIYDVTGIDLDTQPAYNVQAYDCEESSEQMQVPVFVSDRDYQGEIGYVTDEGEWLKLARSNRIRMPVPNFTVDGDEVKSTHLDVNTTATLPEEALKSSWITIVPHDRQSARVHLVVSQAAKDAAKQQGGQQYQLRIYDVTDVDLDSQTAQKIQQYDCEESIQKQEIPINTTSISYVDYLAEIGYVTDNSQWLRIARSNPLRIPVLNQADDLEAVETILPDEATLGADVISQKSGSKEETAIATSNINPGDCEIQHLVVHSRNNCYSLNDAQIKGLQETAVSETLEPGIYVMRIKSGTFGYGSNVCPSGEPFVLLWIFGGKVKNKKTNIPVEQTWSTLNGYQETLTLEVLETTTLYVFFIDTYPDDNNGELTVSVAKLYS